MSKLQMWFCPTCDEINGSFCASCNNCGQGKPTVALNAAPVTAVSSGSSVLHQSSSASVATSSADPPARRPPHSIAVGSLRRTSAEQEGQLRRRIQELQDEAYARRLVLEEVGQAIPDEPTATGTRTALPRSPPPVSDHPSGNASSSTQLAAALDTEVRGGDREGVVRTNVNQRPRHRDPEPPTRRQRTIIDITAEPRANHARGVPPPTVEEVRSLPSTASSRRAGPPASTRTELAGGGTDVSQDVRDLLEHLIQNLEREQQPRGMSQEAIDSSTLTNTLERLPVSMGERSTCRTEESTQCQCMVCLENLSEGDELRTLPCFHRFHRECIDTWLGQSITCPVCKHSLVANSSSAEEVD